MCACAKYKHNIIKINNQKAKEFWLGPIPDQDLAKLQTDQEFSSYQAHKSYPNVQFSLLCSVYPDKAVPQLNDLGMDDFIDSTSFEKWKQTLLLSLELPLLNACVWQLVGIILLS